MDFFVEKWKFKISTSKNFLEIFFLVIFLLLKFSKCEISKFRTFVNFQISNFLFWKFLRDIFEIYISTTPTHFFSGIQKSYLECRAMSLKVRKISLNSRRGCNRLLVGRGLIGGAGTCTVVKLITDWENPKIDNPKNDFSQTCFCRAKFSRTQSYVVVLVFEHRNNPRGSQNVLR